MCIFCLNLVLCVFCSIRSLNNLSYYVHAQFEIFITMHGILHNNFAYHLHISIIFMSRIGLIFGQMCSIRTVMLSMCGVFMVLNCANIEVLLDI